jgi:acyl carrier protein
MEDKEIFAKLERILRNPNYFKIPNGTKISQETRLDETKGGLRLDSLDTYELIFAIEEDFEITIPEEKAYEFETIGDYCTYIKENWVEPVNYFPKEKENNSLSNKYPEI